MLLDLGVGICQNVLGAWPDSEITNVILQYGLRVFGSMLTEGFDLDAAINPFLLKRIKAHMVDSQEPGNLVLQSFAASSHYNDADAEPVPILKLLLGGREGVHLVVNSTNEVNLIANNPALRQLLLYMYNMIQQGNALKLI